MWLQVAVGLSGLPLLCPLGEALLFGSHPLSFYRSSNSHVSEHVLLAP